MVESPVKGHWQDCRIEISAPRAFWQGERGKKRAGSGRCGPEHGAVTPAYVERPRAVASGGRARSASNGCWIKVAARPSHNLPGVSMRWRSLKRYRPKRAAGKYSRRVRITHSTAWTKPDRHAMRSSGMLGCCRRHLLVARPASGTVRGLPESIGRYLS